MDVQLGDSMKCHLKEKKCKPAMLFRAKGDNFICAGQTKKGTMYKNDTIWLCLKGDKAKARLEMTKAEAALVASALCCAIGGKT